MCAMQVRIFETATAMSMAAAEHASRTIRRTLASQGRARIVAATGASQLQFLSLLVAVRDIDWSKVELFHLDV